jgi:hypothetical protein
MASEVFRVPHSSETIHSSALDGLITLGTFFEDEEFVMLVRSKEVHKIPNLNAIQITFKFSAITTLEFNTTLVASMVMSVSYHSYYL